MSARSSSQRLVPHESLDARHCSSRRSASRHARPAGHGPPSRPTRASIEPGALFVALAGERFDGHDYLAAARGPGRHGGGRAARHAAGAGPGAARGGRHPPRLWRRRARAAADVQGSGGVRHREQRQDHGQGDGARPCSGTRYRVHATRANNNNLVGVPLTILEAPWDVEALVIEGGGERAGRAAAIPRDHRAHHHGRDQRHRGSPRGLRVARGHCRGYRRVADGVELAVVGMEPPSLAEGPGRWPARVITVGMAGADRIPVGARHRCDLARPASAAGRPEVQLPLPGRHQAAQRRCSPGRWRRRAGSIPRPAATALALGDGSGRTKRTDPGRGAHDPQRLLQRQPPFLRRLDRHGAANCGAGDAWCSWRARCASWGTTPTGCTAKSPRQIVALDPELHRGGGRVRPGVRSDGRRPWATGSSPPMMRRRWDRCLQPRLRGDEAARAERVPRGRARTYTSGHYWPCRRPALRPDALLPARPAGQEVPPLQSLQLHQLPRGGRDGHGAAHRVRRRVPGSSRGCGRARWAR